MTFDYHKDLIRTCLIVELRIACKLRYQLRDAPRILPNDCRSCGHGARVTRRYFCRSFRCDFDTEMDFDIFCLFGAFCNIWPTFFSLCTFIYGNVEASVFTCLFSHSVATTFPWRHMNQGIEPGIDLICGAKVYQSRDRRVKKNRKSGV